MQCASDSLADGCIICQHQADIFLLIFKPRQNYQFFP